MFVRNGIPDGFVVRLTDLKEEHFPTATRVEEKRDGSLEIWNDRVFLKSYKKGEHVGEFWKVVKERPKRSRRRG
jgi:hypothetical protein